MNLHVDTGKTGPAVRTARDDLPLPLSSGDLQKIKRALIPSQRVSSSPFLTPVSILHVKIVSQYISYTRQT